MGAGRHPRLIVLLYVLLAAMLMPSATAQPALLLQKTWGGSQSDSAYDVANDSNGNIYTTGSTLSYGPGSPSNSSLTLLEYNSTGSLVWQRIWSGSGNGSDVGWGVAVDTFGNIYVVGETDSLGAGGYDLLLLKFNSSGSLLWQKTWGGTGWGGGDNGRDVAVDASGNIYVTGYTANFGGWVDVFLLKFDSSGSLLWQRSWGGSDIDESTSVAVDSSGNIYVAGDTESYSAGSFDVFLLKFAATGDLLWQRTWGGSKGDYGLDVAVDASGSVYMTGFTENLPDGSAGGFLLKLSSTGSLLWQKTIACLGTGVAANSAGNIYVAGFAQDALLLELDPSGHLVGGRTVSLGSASLFSSSPYRVVVDSSANIVVTGSTEKAPPYTLGTSGTNTVGTLSLPLVVGKGAVHTIGASLGNPAGIVQTISGNESYAGGGDQFLVKISTPLTPFTQVEALTPAVAFYALLTVSTILAFWHRNPVPRQRFDMD